MYFTLYEVTNHNDVLIQKEHIIEERVCFSNVRGDIICNWFYRLHGNQLSDNIMQPHHYVTIDGGDLLEIISCLEHVLNEEDKKVKDMKAVHYFPVVYVLTEWINDVGMWSDEYYNHLTEIYNELKKIIPSNSVGNRERLFLYNIS